MTAKQTSTDDELPDNVLVLPVAKVELCTAKGNVRYYLNYPYLDLSDKKKPMLVATNGHVLAAAPVLIGSKVKEGPLPLAALKAARAVRSKQPQIGHRLYLEGAMVGTGDVMYKRPDGDFKFPDWRKVFVPPETDRKPDVRFNGNYMKLMQDVFGGTLMMTGLSVFLGRDGKATDPTKPILVRGSNPDARDTIAVVMPMRNLDAIQRADFKTRQEGLQIQRQNGALSANE